MGFQPVEPTHPLVRWNRQAAPLFVFGIPEGWEDLDLARFNRTDPGGTPAIAGAIRPDPAGHHAVAVFRGNLIGNHDFTYMLANMPQMVGELEQGHVVGSPTPLLVDGERAFMAHYTRAVRRGDADVPGMYTEVWAAHGGRPYRFVLSGPHANHEACLPYFRTMLATLRWDRDAPDEEELRASEPVPM